MVSYYYRSMGRVLTLFQYALSPLENIPPSLTHEESITKGGFHQQQLTLTVGYLRTLTAS